MNLIAEDFTAITYEHSATAMKSDGAMISSYIHLA